MMLFATVHEKTNDTLRKLLQRSVSLAGESTQSFLSATKIQIWQFYAKLNRTVELFLSEPYCLPSKTVLAAFVLLSKQKTSNKTLKIPTSRSTFADNSNWQISSAMYYSLYGQRYREVQNNDAKTFSHAKKPHTKTIVGDTKKQNSPKSSSNVSVCETFTASAEFWSRNSP